MMGISLILRSDIGKCNCRDRKKADRRVQYVESKQKTQLVCDGLYLECFKYGENTGLLLCTYQAIPEPQNISLNTHIVVSRTPIPAR